MSYKTIKQRIDDYKASSKLPYSAIADFADVDVDVIYRLRSGAQKRASEEDAINLHEYLKSKGY